MVGFVYIELSTISAFGVEGSLLRYGPSVISSLSVEGSLLRYGPSAKWSISVEGPALVIEPSAKSAFIVEGSTLGSRTIRDSGPKCGRFGPGEWNQPRNGALAWKVQLLDPELSVISAFSVEGSIPGSRTIRDSGPKRGWFASGYLTIHDMGH